MNHKMRGNLCLLLAAFVWGVAFVAQSAGMEYVGAFTFNGTRSLLAGICLIPVWLIVRTDKRPLKVIFKTPGFKSSMIGGIACGAVYTVASSLQQFGIGMTSAGKAGFITALYIVIVPLLGIFVHKKIPFTAWICVFIAVAGFYLLSFKGNSALCLGDLLLLLCAFAFSGHILVIDHFASQDVDCTLMSCIQFIFAGITMSILMLIFEKPTLSAIWDAKITIAYAGIFSSALGYTMQIVGQKYTESTIASLLMSLESVFAALSGWLILGEHMSSRELTGCALVFIAVIFSQIPLPKLKRR